MVGRRSRHRLPGEHLQSFMTHDGLFRILYTWRVVDALNRNVHVPLHRMAPMRCRLDSVVLQRNSETPLGRRCFNPVPSKIELGLQPNVTETNQHTSPSAMRTIKAGIIGNRLSSAKDPTSRRRQIRVGDFCGNARLCGPII